MTEERQRHGKVGQGKVRQGKGGALGAAEHTRAQRCVSAASLRAIGGEGAALAESSPRYPGRRHATPPTTPGLSCPMCLLDDFIPITAYPCAIAYTTGVSLPAPPPPPPLPYSRDFVTALPQRKRRPSTAGKTASIGSQLSMLPVSGSIAIGKYLNIGAMYFLLKCQYREICFLQSIASFK